MTYRDESQALQSRISALKSQVAELKGEALDPVTFEARAAGLEHELSAVEAQQSAQPFRAPMLDRIKVATPCTRSWHQMDGDEKVRFCGDCQKSVYNLSAMTSADIEGFVVATGGSACIRLFRRADGTVLTQDCDVAVDRLRLTRKRRAQIAALAVGTLVTAGAIEVYHQVFRPQCYTQSVSTGVMAVGTTEVQGL